MTRQRVALLVACALAVLTSSAASSRQAAQPEQPPGHRQIFRTDAALVRVDVRVLREGRALADLARTDFELFEDGVPQRVEAFEYVRAEGARSSVAAEPGNTAAALELAADPRNRVFILFLDNLHVTEVNSLQMPTPLVRLIDNLVAPTDLIGLMTPQMGFDDLILGRRTNVIRSGLLQNRRWGRMVENCRSIHMLDRMEQMYTACYPSLTTQCDISPTAMSLIQRRRESFTLGVLRDLVRSLGARREARTAILLASEGWRLFERDERLANVAAGSPPQIRIGPGGRLGTQDPANFNVDRTMCDTHLRAAAEHDGQRTFQDLIADANRNNASFYMVDPGGLRVDGGRVDTLRTLAENTDGRAIVNTNDIAGGLQRIVNDMSDYYLLGYYSTNTKPDGRYRSIKVKVARPGAEVRARKGYRAFTADEMKSITAARANVSAPVDPYARARAGALGRLARLKPGTTLFVHGSVDPSASAIYVSGELAAATARAPEWRGGGEMQILATAPDGTAATARAPMTPGSRSVLARIPLDGKPAPGEYSVDVRMKPAAGGSPLLETVRIDAPAGAMGEPLAFRSVDRAQPVATFLWFRSETAHLEAPVSADAANPAARLLDRAGSPMALPLSASIRDEGGSRWLVAGLRLAALAPGDYTIELSIDAGGSTTRRYAPLRVDR